MRLQSNDNRSWGGAIARLLTLLVMLPWAGASAGEAFALEIVVPAYFYPSPGSDWGRMTAAVSQAPITAIMNPGNGPGNNLDANYTAVTNAFTGAGGNLIGYVYSSYGARPLNQVLADIDRYAQWYPIEGIFVDEFANNADPAVLDYYNAIYEHVKGINPDWEVMGNPGAHSPPMAGDIDGDGLQDIVYTGISSSIGRKLMVLDHVGVPKPGWPIDVGENIHMQWDFIALGDLDGDGAQEIVWPSRITWSQRQVFAFQGDGTPVAGWPFGSSPSSAAMASRTTFCSSTARRSACLRRASAPRPLAPGQTESRRRLRLGIPGRPSWQSRI